MGSLIGQLSCLNGWLKYRKRPSVKIIQIDFSQNICYGNITYGTLLMGRAGESWEDEVEIRVDEEENGES